jgi:hypothetical protein
MELLGAALGPYVDRRLTKRAPSGGNWRALYASDNVDTDASTLIGVILDYWPNVFRDELHALGRCFLGEARHWRNHWAHNEPFSDADTNRALDTVERLLTLIDAQEASEVARWKVETQRAQADVGTRSAVTGRDGSPDAAPAGGTMDGDVGSLRGEFTRAMLSMCDRFKQEIDYDPARVRQMVIDRGGPEAASFLLAGPQAQVGLETLRWHRRLHESVEAHVLLPRFGPLFTDDERRIARTRLMDHGLDVDAFLRQQ